MLAFLIALILLDLVPVRTGDVLHSQKKKTELEKKILLVKIVL